MPIKNTLNYVDIIKHTPNNLKKNTTMKGIMLIALLALGMGTSANLSAQDATTDKKYHPRYKMTAEHKHRVAMKGSSPEGRHREVRWVETDPKAIAINKTIALDKKVGLTAKQEKQVTKLYLKEAKQEVKLREIRRDNRQEMRTILTKEQFAKASVTPRHTKAQYPNGHYRKYKGSRQHEMSTPQRNMRIQKMEMNKKAQCQKDCCNKS